MQKSSSSSTCTSIATQNASSDCSVLLLQLLLEVQKVKINCLSEAFEIILHIANVVYMVRLRMENCINLVIYDVQIVLCRNLHDLLHALQTVQINRCPIPLLKSPAISHKV